MKKSVYITNFMTFYNTAWAGVLPFLKKHPRLAQTFALRTDAAHLKPADIWIQAASAGEALLAASVLQHLSPVRPVRILVTTTTDQGMEILTGEFKKNRHHPLISLSLGWFPFDQPHIVKAVVEQVTPRVMVLLETELWPALLYFLKQNHTRILVINGRMSRNSGRNYRWTRALWSRIFPHRILAVSRPDAARFKQVFPRSDVAVMPNIKFDVSTAVPQVSSPLPSVSDLFPPGLAVSVLASIRQPEEKQVLEMIRHLLNRVPDQIVAVFPRHMHRLGYWKRRLKKNGLPFYLRSDLSGPPAGPGILLWDRFGEMRSVFTHAHAVFMGGSLTPLGGQNFLEPLLQGAPVITGPFWDDFFWVGQAVFDTGLVQRTPGWLAAADAMVYFLKHPEDREKRLQNAHDYVAARAGGADMACREILAALSDA